MPILMSVYVRVPVLTQVLRNTNPATAVNNLAMFDTQPFVSGRFWCIIYYVTFIILYHAGVHKDSNTFMSPQLCCLD